MTNIQSIDKLLNKAYIVAIRELRRLVNAEFKNNSELKHFCIDSGVYSFNKLEYRSDKVDAFINKYNKALNLNLFIKRKKIKIFNYADRYIIN